MDITQTPGMSRAQADFQNRSDSDSIVGLSSRHGRGPKQLATSPLQEDTSMLTDVDLQALKSDLAGHDYNFAAMNATSKESTVRKKEMEQIIAAYRRAVDRLSMAHVKMKAERDTTIKIWNMVKVEGAGKPNPEDVRERKDHICEAARTTVREELKEWQDTETERAPRDGVPVKSFAAVVGAAGMTSRGAAAPWMPVLGERRREPQRELETIEVLPGKANESKDASATREIILKAIKLNEMGVKMDRIIQSRNKSVRIIAEPLYYRRAGQDKTGLGKYWPKS